MTPDQQAVMEFVRRGDPDAKLPVSLNDAARELVAAGVLRMCGCSDGDYLEETPND